MAARGTGAAGRPDAPHRRANHLRRSDPDAQSLVRALVQRLQELGWSDGRIIRIDYRWAAAERGRAQALAEELVEMHPDLIVACAGPAAVALWRATRSIPIVFVQVIDPVALGIVKTMAHPGGNITGFTHFEATIGGKWLELLKEIAPGVDLVTVLFDPDNPTSPIYVRAIELAAPSAPADLAKQLGNYPELGRAAARRIPNAKLIEFPELGHAPQIQAPDQFHEALLKSLSTR